MNAESTATSRAEIVDELSKWTVGGGLIVLVLFPLAVPILVLTAVALVPLLAPILALGLLVGVVALPVLLARKDGDGRSRRGVRPPPLAPIRPCHRRLAHEPPHRPNRRSQVRILSGAL